MLKSVRIRPCPFLYPYPLAVPASLIPELSDPGWQPAFGEVVFDAPHHAVFENAVVRSRSHARIEHARDDIARSHSNTVAFETAPRIEQDFAHVHFIHSSSFGSSEAPTVRDMRTEAEDWGVRCVSVSQRRTRTRTSCVFVLLRRSCDSLPG